VNFVRNMMCIMPFLALFSSIGFLFVIDSFINIARKIVPPSWFKWRTIFVLGLLMIAILTPLLKSTESSWELYTKKETRVAASEWLAQNIPPGSNVLFMAQLHFFEPHVIGKQYNALIDSKLDRPIEWYAENNIDYIVTSSAHDDRLLKDKSLVDQFNAAFKEFPVLKKISGWPLSLSALSINPVIKILRVPKVPFPINKQIYKFNLRGFKTTPAKIKYNVNEGLPFYWNGKARSYLIGLSQGTYRFLINTRGTSALGVGPIMRVGINKIAGEEETFVFVREFEVIDTFKTYSLEAISLEKGNYRVEISFINDLWLKKDGVRQDRNLFVKDVILKRL
jgi:hypothetical protein